MSTNVLSGLGGGLVGLCGNAITGGNSPIWIWTKRILIVVIICGMIFAVWKIRRVCLKRKQKKHREMIERVCEKTPSGDTIFVSIASYRDPECIETVFDCFEKASCPFRVHIGVCQQNEDPDQNVLEAYSKKADRDGVGNFKSNMRIHVMSASDAKGPMYARALIEKHLYQNEKYYLVIDSHTLFCENWDQLAIDMLNECSRYAPKPVLTMYPDNYDSRSKLSGNDPPSYLRFKKFNAYNGLPEIEGPKMKKMPSRCFPSLFWGGCFAFSNAQVIREVPFDPNLWYVFFGEEISMAARLFTSGWDLFTPKAMLVKHMWKRKRPTFWEQFMGDSVLHQQRRQQEAEAYHRLRVVMQVEPLRPGETPVAYGMGRVRPLSAYENYCGINFLAQQVTRHARLGVSKDADTEEIIAKFGSIGEFQNIK